MSTALRYIAGIPERFSTAFQKVRQGTWETKLFVLGIALALLVGFILRVSGQYFDPTSLWLDEAAWAERLIDQSVLEMPIRPIAYMWVSQQLIALTAPNEFWLRFLPNTASIVALGFIPYVASQLFESKVSRFVLVLVWAIQPALIDYAKEFKPYSFEVLVHLIPLLLYLKYRQTGKLAYFWTMVGLMPVLFLFAYNLAFTFPGVFLWALYESYKQRKLQGAMVPVVSGVVCLTLIAGLYSLTLHKASTGENETYWGRKYDVFYTAFQVEQGTTRSSWWARKYTDMASLPGLRREIWHPPAFVPERVVEAGFTADRVFWLALHFAGLAYLLVRKRELFILLVTPFLILIALNIIGRWPIGAFRTNVFLCVYMLPIAVFGFDWLARRSFKSAAGMGAVVTAVTLLPAFAYGFDIREKKIFWGARNHEARDMIVTLKEQREAHLRANPSLGKEYLLFDCHMTRPFRYYMNLHPEFKAKYSEFFKKNFELGKGCSLPWFNRTLKARLRRTGEPFWVIASKRKAVEPTRRAVHKSGRVIFEERFGSEHIVDHLMFYVEPLKGPKKPKAAVPPSAEPKAAPEQEEELPVAGPNQDADDDKEAPAPAGSADRDDDD